MVKWSRSEGYEVSSLGDWRFSAFNAILYDGRSIEHHYLIDELFYRAKDNGNTLRDRFASSPVNQARALADIINDIYYK